MRIRLLALGLLLPTILGAAPPAAKDPLHGCLLAPPSLARLSSGAEYRRLDELPPAAEILTIIHAENGCPKPVIVREGIGGNPSFAK